MELQEDYMELQEDYMELQEDYMELHGATRKPMELQELHTAY